MPRENLEKITIEVSLNVSKKDWRIYDSQEYEDCQNKIIIDIKNVVQWFLDNDKYDNKNFAFIKKQGVQIVISIGENGEWSKEYKIKKFEDYAKEENEAMATMLAEI